MRLGCFYIMKPIFIFCDCILIKVKQSINAFDCFQLGNSFPVFTSGIFAVEKKLLKFFAT